MPDEVLHDAVLNAAIAVLPANYNFEVRGLVPWADSPPEAPPACEGVEHMAHLC